MIKLIQQIYGIYPNPYYFTELLRYLTHTGVGVSPIQVSVSHPYTLRYLTHRTFRNHLVLRTAFLLCSG